MIAAYERTVILRSLYVTLQLKEVGSSVTSAAPICAFTLFSLTVCLAANISMTPVIETPAEHISLASTTPTSDFNFESFHSRSYAGNIIAKVFNDVFSFSDSEGAVWNV